jgi:hypothetical protein
MINKEEVTTNPGLRVQIVDCRLQIADPEAQS